MNEIEHIRKLLADNKVGEKGWRKALATSAGSYSRTLAEKNLSRLAASREVLLTQLNAVDLYRQSGSEPAAKIGMAADELSRNVLERLFRQS